MEFDKCKVKIPHVCGLCKESAYSVQIRVESLREGKDLPSPGAFQSRLGSSCSVVRATVGSGVEASQNIIYSRKSQLNTR